MKEALSLTNENRKRLLAELEKYGIVLKPTAADVMEDVVLERLLHEIRKSNDDDVVVEPKFLNNNMANDVYDRYSAMATDQVSKSFIASLLFFSSYPWLALWWPPLYYRYYKVYK